jgi:hypothetical protein
VIVAIAVPIGLWRAYRADAQLTDRWAGDRGLALTPASRAMVEAYLHRARLLRTWGGVAGVLVPTLGSWIFEGRFVVLGIGSDGESAPLGFGAIFVGYLLGALCAEVSLVRRAQGRRRTAGLLPRELPDYLPRYEVLAQRLLGAAAALGLVALGVVPYPAGTSDPTTASLAAGAVVLLAFAAGLEAVERWLVRRPQPFTEPALVAADDAIRAQSIRAVAGAGLALLLLAACGICLGLQASEVDALQRVMPVPAAACLVLSLFAGRDVADGTWRVRRPASA